MPARQLTDLVRHSDLRTTVTVGGRRWRQLPTIDALWGASSDSTVYVLDASTGAVRFGNGVHGARPPAGTRVRVLYRQGGQGAAGNVTVTWEGRWPPRTFELAEAIAPSCLTVRSPGRRETAKNATR